MRVFGDPIRHIIGAGLAPPLRSPWPMFLIKCILFSIGKMRESPHFLTLHYITFGR
jgi:hypothetical protein